MNFPILGSLKSKALLALLEGRSFTQSEAFEKSGPIALISMVNELRNDGWPIQCESYLGISDHCMQSVPYCQYYIEERFLERLRQEILEYYNKAMVWESIQMEENHG